MGLGSLLTIGDFSKATNLSVKTLRHYHSVGLLEPIDVNSGTGYRYYAAEQVPAAQVIRRLRGLEMPVDEVRAVLAADDVIERNALIAAHLDRLERQLREMQHSVTELRNLLRPVRAIGVEHRSVGPTNAVAIRETVGRDQLGTWWPAALQAIDVHIAATDAPRTGPPGGLFASELFLYDEGECVLFVPVDGRPTDAGRVQLTIIPAAELAVVVHMGSHDDVDVSYGALGTHVARHALGVEGPLREHYVVGPTDTDDPAQWITEICWPIFQTAANTNAVTADVV